MHVRKFPQHSWSIILQQAWSMCLKDRIHVNTSNDDAKFGNLHKIKEPCKRYNRGKCTYGARCRYEHRCAIKKCGKFGHGAHICRLRDQSNETGGNSDASAKQGKSSEDK